LRIIRDIPKYEREESKWMAGALERSEAEVKEILNKEERVSLKEDHLHRGHYSIEPNEYKPATCKIDMLIK